MEELACPICLISSSSSCAGNEEDDDHGRSSLDETTMTNDDEQQHRPQEQPDEERPILFLRTPCNHIFCRSCIERVLLRPRQQRQRGGGSTNRMPTRGPCPMCRATISLFDLVLVVPPALAGVEAATTTDEKRDGNDGGGESLVYRSDSNVRSWPIANCRYKQRLLLPSTIHQEEDSILIQRLFDEGGIVEGYGIEFCFSTTNNNDSGDDNVVIPSILLPRSSMTATADNSDDDDDNIIIGSDTRYEFDDYYFHRESMTYYGKVNFPNWIADNDNDVRDGGFGAGSFYYAALECYLHFANSGHYIRTGELRWQYANTSRDGNDNYSFDGSWEVRYQNNTSFVIYVQSHTFKINDDTTSTAMPIVYRINIDENNHHLLSMEPLFSNRHPTYISNREVTVPDEGEEIINVGETITWTIDSGSDGRVQVWKRLTSSLENCYKVVPITVGTFVYHKITTTTTTLDSGGDDHQLLGPRYNSNTVWGNTFCQGMCVGMASYHFMNTNDTINSNSSNSTYQAYISYESPRTEVWPPLDNGNPIPSRVPFRNIRWDVRTRTFRGDICWLDDFDTTWTNETKWSYTIVFDSTYSFISSGTVSRSLGGRPHQFGIDLVYINAALETPLRERMVHQQQQQTTTTGVRSPSAYLDIVRQWRDVGHASTATLDMLGEVAMGVMDNRESMIDFNL